jgi:hypothetical protein
VKHETEVFSTAEYLRPFQGVDSDVTGDRATAALLQPGALSRPPFADKTLHAFLSHEPGTAAPIAARCDAVARGPESPGCTVLDSNT